MPLLRVLRATRSPQRGNPGGCEGTLLRRAFTSLSGGPLQPLVRQLRYYSVPVGGASESQALRSSGKSTWEAAKECPDAGRAPLVERRPSFLCWSLASQLVSAGDFPSRLSGSLGRSPFFKGRSLAWGGCSCRVPCFVWVGRSALQLPVHHWHPPYSNWRAVLRLLKKRGLRGRRGCRFIKSNT